MTCDKVMNYDMLPSMTCLCFFRRAYEKLQLEKEQEMGILKEQNQRLQVQLNNSQLSLQDLKRKSSQQVQELESRISLLTRKVIMITFNGL